MIQRVASVIRLPIENVEKYESLHAAVWPEVLAQLSARRVTNYSIHRWGEILFSYLEYVGDDLEADMTAIAADPMTQQWWAVCNPLQRPVEDCDPGEWWHGIPEVFHLN